MNLEKARSRAWVEIDEDALIYHYRLAKSLCNDQTKLICVVKANAYGLGLFRVVETLAREGADWFSVATAEEALCARRAAPRASILLMSPAEPSYLEELIQKQISLTIGREEDAQLASEAAGRLCIQARVHIKTDTGLHRLGFQNADEILPLRTLPFLSFEGIYSHLALRSDAQSHVQYAQFRQMTNALSQAGFKIEMRHLLDSIGLTRYPEWQMDGVRIGAFLYGNVPPAWERFSETKNVLSFKARVTRVAWVKKGDGVGYDDRPLARDTKTATIAAGYVDGYPRVLSQGGYVYLHGMRAPLLGLICMDQMMVDVTDIPSVQVGDVATLLGDEMDLRVYASLGKLNRNECLAMIGRRIPRVYFRQGAPAAVFAEMDEGQ